MSLLNSLKNRYKGWDGELTVKLMQWWYLDKKIPTYSTTLHYPISAEEPLQLTTLCSVYGIFVIETKNMNGWIYGKEKEPTWTQVFFRKIHLPKPLRQNYKHTKSIS